MKQSTMRKTSGVLDYHTYSFLAGLHAAKVFNGAPAVVNSCEDPFVHSPVILLD
jgi:hypothetical protein